jgi:hypothetical protein
MKDLKQSYDKLLVAASGLAALGIAAYVVMGSADLSTSLEAPPVVDKGEAFAPSTELARLKADVDAMSQPAAWNDGPGSLFASRIYLLREGRLVDILESGNDLFPGIPNSWILEHNLDYTDAQLPELDPDKDGFSSLEEYTGKTNPDDASSTPPVWTKLRMTASKIEQLQILFTRVSEDGGAWINSTSGGQGVKGQSQLYTIGSEIHVNEFQEGLTKPKTEGTIFKLVRVDKSEQPIPGIPGAKREVYSAVLQSSVDKKEIVLEQEKPATSPYSKATLLDTRPGGQTWEGRAGQSFKLGESESFMLVDVFPDKAIIQRLDSEEKFEVPFDVAAPPPEQPTEPVAQ